MKKIYILASLACLVMFSSCSSDDNQIIQDTEVAPKEEIIRVGVGLSLPNDTRVNTEDLLNMKWELNDKLLAVGISTYGSYKGTTEFKLAKGEGTENAVFEGPAVKDAVNYKLIYLGKNSSYTHDMWNPTLETNYLGQVQNVPASTASIKDCMVLESPQFNPKDPNAKVSMAIKNSVLRVNIMSLPDAIKDASQFDVKCMSVTTSGNNEIAGLTYNGKIVAGEKNYLFMSFDSELPLPFNSALRFEITANGQTAKATIDTPNGKTYAAGKIYTIKLDYANPGSWKWEAPQAQSHDLFTDDFTSDKGWTESHSNPSVGDVWQVDFDNQCLKFNNNDIIPAEITDPFDTRVISPAVDLKANNYVSFEYYMTFYADINFFIPKTKFYVREVGTQDWTEITSFPAPTPDYAIGNVIQTGEMAVPADFNNKKVEFSFTSASKPYQFFAMKHTGCLIVLDNFLVTFK